MPDDEDTPDPDSSEFSGEHPDDPQVPITEHPS